MTRAKNEVSNGLFMSIHFMVGVILVDSSYCICALTLAAFTLVSISVSLLSLFLGLPVVFGTCPHATLCIGSHVSTRQQFILNPGVDQSYPGPNAQIHWKPPGTTMRSSSSFQQLALYESRSNQQILKRLPSIARCAPYPVSL